MSTPLPEGFEVPIHRSLTEPLLFAGLPRNLRAPPLDAGDGGHPRSLSALVHSHPARAAPAVRLPDQERALTSSKSSPGRCALNDVSIHDQRAAARDRSEGRIAMFSLREYRQPTRPPPRPPAVGGNRRRTASSSRRTASYKRPSPSADPISPARARPSSSPASPASTTPFGASAPAGASSSRRSAQIANDYPHSTWPNPASWLRRRRAPRDISSAPARASSRATTSPSSGTRPRRAHETRRGSLLSRTLRTGKPNDRALRPSQQFRKTVARARRHHGRRLLRGAGARRRRDADLPPLHHLDEPAPRQNARHPDVPRRASSPTWRSPPATSPCSATTTSRPARSPRSRPAPTPESSTISTSSPSSTAGSPASSSWTSRKPTRELQKYRKGWFQKQKGIGALLKEQAMKHESAFVDGARYRQVRRRRRRPQPPRQRTLSPSASSRPPSPSGTETSTSPAARSRRSSRSSRAAASSCKDETLNSRDAWLGSPPRQRLRERPAPDPPHGQSRAAHARLRRLGRRHRERPPPQGVRRRHLPRLLQHQRRHAVPPEPRRPGRRPHPHHRPDRRRQEHAPRSAGAAVAALPEGPGRHLRQGSQRARRHLGRRWLLLRARATKRRRCAFQPLAHIDQRAERVWATQFVLNLLAAQNVHADPRRQEPRCRRRRCASPRADAPHRTLSVLAGLLGPELGDRPQALHRRSERRALRPDLRLQARPTRLSALGFTSRWATSWPSARRRSSPPSTTSSTGWSRRFDGNPTLLILDEAWLFLEAPDLRAATRRSGSRRCERRTSTSSSPPRRSPTPPTSPILSTILSACPTKIYLPNEEALTPQIAAAYTGFGLSETEIGILAQAQKKRDYYYRSVRGRRLFTLDLGPVALAFAGMSTPADQRFLDESRRRRSARLVRRSESFATAASPTPPIVSSPACVAPSPVPLMRRHHMRKPILVTALLAGVLGAAPRAAQTAVVDHSQPHPEHQNRPADRAARREHGASSSR